MTLNAMTSFPMILESSDTENSPISVIWLKPTAFATEYDAVNDTLNSVTIHSGYGEYAVLLNSSNTYYRTDAAIWEPIPDGDEGDGFLGGEFVANRFSANSIFG